LSGTQHQTIPETFCKFCFQATCHQQQSNLIALIQKDLRISFL
jgi:hypothetical protein